MSGKYAHSFFRQILAFPVLVTVIVSVTFLCGGHCGVWQWWLAVGTVLVLGCWRRPLREMAVQSALFVVVLLAYGLLCRLIVTSGPLDMVVYHNPAIRLLSLGWNPVYDATPAAIQSAMGIESSWFRVWHVLSIPKAAWYFNAVAYLFHGNAFNLMFGIYPLLLCSVGYQLLKVLEGSAVWFKLLAILFVGGISPSFDVVVDAVVAFSFMGLLLTMWRYLHDGDWDGLSLFVFSFWMCTAKHMCLMHCAFAWLVFAALCVRDLRQFRRFALMAGSLFAAVVLVCVSPYLTQWKNFGHPLYPCYTADESRNPVINIVAEFEHRNDDAKSLGHVGTLVNSYVSENLAGWYGRRCTGKEAFCPSASWWSQQTANAESHGPTNCTLKLALWIVFAVVMLFGCRADRIVLGISSVCLLLVPTPMLGYLRYTPWYLWGIVLVVRIVARWPRRWLRWSAFGVLLVLGFVFSFGSLPLTTATRIDAGFAVRQVMREAPPRKLYCPSFASALTPEREREATLANVLLLQRQDSRLRSAEIVRVPEGDGATTRYERRLQGMTAFLDSTFYVEGTDAERLLDASAWLGFCRMPRRERLKAYPLYILKSWFVTLPRSVGLVLQDAFGGSHAF